MSKLTIIIPSYNEEQNLRDFLPKIYEFCNKHSFKLILVDDGSTDNSYKVYESFLGNNFF